MLLDLLSRPKPLLELDDRGAAPALTITGATESPLRLVDVSTPPVHSRTASKRIGRRSEAIGGRAYVLHPDSATRAQFETVLRNLGMVAVDFEDHADLVAAIASEHPEIILWGMPGCSSHQLEPIRNVARDRYLPIVVVASLGDELTVDDIQDAGGCDLLTLPLPCHRLAPALTLAMLRFEALLSLAAEHAGDENRKAARNLVWRAARVRAKRRAMTEAEALSHILSRSRHPGQTLTRTAMEVVAEGLFP